MSEQGIDTSVIIDENTVLESAKVNIPNGNEIVKTKYVQECTFTLYEQSRNIKEQGNVYIPWMVWKTDVALLLLGQQNNNKSPNHQQ